MWTCTVPGDITSRGTLAMRMSWAMFAMATALATGLAAFPSIRVDGQAVRGALTADDMVYLSTTLDLDGLQYSGGDRYHDVYTFRGNRMDAVEVELTAQRDDSGALFDTYLIVAGPGGVVAHTRSVTVEGGQTYAGLPTLALHDNGEHYIIVTSLGAHVTGPYTLRVRVASATDDVRLNQFPQTLNGNLMEGHNAYLPEGESAGYDCLRDGYVFSVDEPSEVSITLHCQGYDGTLYLLGPDNRIFSQAPTMSINRTPAVIETRLHSVGDHRIVVATPRRPFGESPYTLRVNVAQVEEEPSPTPGPPSNYDVFIQGLQQRQNP